MISSKIEYLYVGADMYREVWADRAGGRFRLNGLHLIRWGWNVHWMGGEFRRLWTLRAGDRQKLMSAWAAIVNDLQSEQPFAMQEFLGICPSHDDYMWRLVK